MILPDHDRCSKVLRELDGDPGLSEWESEFVESNLFRSQFTDKQREIIAKLMEKYEV